MFHVEPSPARADGSSVGFMSEHWTLPQASKATQPLTGSLPWGPINPKVEPVMTRQALMGCTPVAGTGETDRSAGAP
jgi:hypothetical protein